MEKERIIEDLNSCWNIETFQEVTSTNDILKQRAPKGLADRTVLIAERQTKGKGRMGRSFYSPEENGIYMSFLLRPQIPPDQALLLTSAAAVAAARAIDDVGGGPALIKWVNDIYCRGRKVVGILTEAGFSKDDASQGLDYAVVGIGINVWEAEGGFPVEIRDIAGAVFPWEKRPDRREERDRLKAQIIVRLLDYFDAIYKQLPEKQFMEIYREKSLLIGKNVMVMSSTHQKMGSDPVHVIGVGDNAELIVQDQEGKVTRLFSGEVSVREI